MLQCADAPIDLAMKARQYYKGLTKVPYETHLQNHEVNLIRSFIAWCITLYSGMLYLSLPDLIKRPNQIISRGEATLQFLYKTCQNLKRRVMRTTSALISRPLV